MSWTSYAALFEQLNSRFIEAFNLVEESQMCQQLGFNEDDVSDRLLFQMAQRGRSLAQWVFREEKKLTHDSLNDILSIVKPHINFSYPFDQFQQKQFKLVVQWCELLRSDEKLLVKFNRCGPPFASEYVAKIVRDTLQMEEGSIVGEKEAKMALFSAMITPLRQSVGSCFATAPAILIQNEQADLMLDDLFELITLGRIKRVMQGEEVKVPLSIKGSEHILNQSVNNVHPAYFILMSGLTNVKPLYMDQIKGTSTFQQIIRQILMSNSGLIDGDIESVERYESSSSQHLKVKSKEWVSKRQKVEALLNVERHIHRKIATTFSNSLLKCWEYTLASLTDFEVNAFKWNMVAALGFNHQEKGGIGQLIYSYLEERLKTTNEELMSMQQEVDRTKYQLNAIQTLLQTATSESRIRALKSEAQAQMNHLRTSEEMLQELNEDAKYTSQFFIYLLEQYESFFKLYFQEIYEPSVAQVQPQFYSDSPAGFRLVYKHGRNEPLVWDQIYTEKQYIEALENFFRAVEALMINGCEWEKGKGEIEYITRQVCAHIQTKLFIESAFQRIKKGPSQGEKTPWSYVSGGTLESLVRCYYSQQNHLKYDIVKPENWQELAIHWIDLFKELPEDAQSKLLLETPTHAALISPQCALFKEGYEDKGFTYTWIRDHVIEPAKQLYLSTLLSPKEQEFLTARFIHQVGIPLTQAQYLPYIQSQHVNLKMFYETILKMFSQSHYSLSKELLEEQIASFLHSALPLFSSDEVKEWIKDDQYINGEFMTFSSLCHCLKFIFMQRDGLEKNHEEHITSLLTSKGKILPPKLLVADSNWTPFYLSFQINPVTFEFELWRTTPCLLKGYPMSHWKGLFEDKSRGWKIYIQKKQYSARSLPSNLLENVYKRI